MREAHQYREGVVFAKYRERIEFTKVVGIKGGGVE